MKLLNKLGLIMLLVVFAFAACEKAPDLTYYKNGTAVVLTASKTTVAPATSDSANVVVSFSWTSHKYEQDSSLYKFILEIDYAGRNIKVLLELKRASNPKYVQTVRGFGYRLGG